MADDKMETDEEKAKREAEEKLIRELHGIPEEPENTDLEKQPPTPEADKDEETGDKNEEEEDEPIPEHLLKLPRIICVQNISRKATKAQISTLFGFIGKIEEIETFPSEGTACAARASFLKFRNPLDAGVSVYLTNTVFIDRPLQVTIWEESTMPDMATGLKKITPLQSGYMYGKTENSEEGHGMKKENLMSGFQSYSSMHIDDIPAIDRAIHVENLDEILVSEVSLVQFLAIAGPVNLIRITGTEAYCEFLHSRHVAQAMKLNGATFLGKRLVIRYAEQRDALLKKVEETEKSDTMRRVLAAQSLIEEVVEAGKDESAEYYVKKERVKKETRKERSRSRSRDRSGSKTSRRRSRSREKHRKRRRSRSRERKKDKKSRRSRSRDKERRY